ncbi:phage holin family protein [Weissella confusa]|uniref:phage holin family protein n=1 Tax=Weissella confusa TaxID=1583 RepID=UPI001C6FA8F3|nr:phage holin family protein [Weissella confusa]QYU58219.1 phage holin family protein [Weissella confusa]
MDTILGVAGGTAFIVSYLINATLKSTPAVNNKWLPLIGVAIGAIVGIAFGLADGNFSDSIVMGMLAGGNSTTFNELYNHLFGGKNNAAN